MYVHAAPDSICTTAVELENRSHQDKGDDSDLVLLSGFVGLVASGNPVGMTMRIATDGWHNLELPKETGRKSVDFDKSTDYSGCLLGSVADRSVKVVRAQKTDSQAELQPYLTC